MYANTQLAAEVLRSGASGFIVKDAAGPELIAAVHVVLRGRTYDLAEHVLARLPRSGLTIAERSQAEVALTGIAGENQPPPSEGAREDVGFHRFRKPFLRGFCAPVVEPWPPRRGLP